MKSLYIYGAGNSARKIFDLINKLPGFQVDSFVVDDRYHKDEVICGVKCIKLSDAKHQIGWGTQSVLIGICNAAASSAKLTQRLRDEGVRSDLIVSQSEITRFLDIDEAPQITPVPRHFVYSDEVIAEIFSRLSDRKSRDVYMQHLRLHKTGYSCGLDAYSLSDIYFPRDIEFSFKDIDCFVDLGAYDGDSIKGYVRARESLEGTIIAVEPDPINFSRLHSYTQSLTDRFTCHLHQKGISDRIGFERFSGTGDMDSSFSDAGEELIEVTTIERVLGASANYNHTYFKFDIEGMELGSIANNPRIVANANSSLAVSLYHNPYDIVRIPQLIMEFCKSHNFYVRSHGVDGTDLVLYALRNR